MSHQKVEVLLISDPHLGDDLVLLLLLFPLRLLLFLDGRFCIQPGGQLLKKHGGLGVYRPEVPMEDGGEGDVLIVVTGPDVITG